jgi:hypothetical protein
MFMYLLQNEIMSVIMTIIWLQKISYIDIFQCLCHNIISDDIIGQ